jgi:hypothetical protein
MACWRHVCDLPAYDPCCYYAQFQEVCYLRLQWSSGQCETERRLWCTRRSLLFGCKDMSACVIYSTQFQEVVIRSIPISDAVASVNGRGTAWYCESVFKTEGEQQGTGMGTAWERHGMCESAIILSFREPEFVIECCYVVCRKMCWSVHVNSWCVCNDGLKFRAFSASVSFLQAKAWSLFLFL